MSDLRLMELVALVDSDGKIVTICIRKPEGGGWDVTEEIKNLIGAPKSIETLAEDPLRGGIANSGDSHGF